MKVPLALLVATFAAFTNASGLTADDIASLELRSPLPTADNLSVAVSLSNDRFIVAGNGSIALSEDAGDTWSVADGPDSNWSQGASNGSNLHVLLAPSTWAVSEDGLTWRSGRISPFILPIGAVYGKGKFVIIGANRDIRHSVDGANWTRATLDEAWSSTYSILYDGSRFLAVTDKGVIVSDDAETWAELSTFPDKGVLDLSFAGDTYCAGGRNGLLYTSQDATNWEIRETGYTYQIEAAYKAHGRYYVKASGFILVTNDFQSFERVSPLVNGQWGLAIDDTSETMVASGSSGLISKSVDGNQWTDQRKIVGRNFNSVAYGNGVFVAADSSNGTLYHSTDGIEWLASETSAPGLSDIVFFRDQFRSLGNFGLLTSPDGMTWTTKEGPGNVGGLQRLLVLNERLIGVGPTGNLYQSLDGEAWTEHALPLSDGDRLEYATFGKGLYVVVGKGESIFTSPDLTTWTARTLEEPYQLQRVHFDGSHFYAFNNLRSAPLVSTDGILWEIPTDMPTMTGRGSLWDDELGIYFIISGFIQWHSPGADPLDWESLPMSHRLDINQVTTSSEGIVVAVGDSGLIMSGTPNVGYSGWIDTYFPRSDANRGIAADPDKDGQSNLEEYAAGTDPTMTNRSLATMEVNAREGDATLSWKQVDSADDVHVRVEFSQDLRTWRTIEDAEIDDRSEILSATIALPSTNEPRYYRLQWELK